MQLHFGDRKGVDFLDVKNLLILNKFAQTGAIQ
jgi:hypothetical protein